MFLTDTKKDGLTLKITITFVVPLEVEIILCHHTQEFDSSAGFYTTRTYGTSTEVSVYLFAGAHVLFFLATQGDLCDVLMLMDRIGRK